MKLKVVYFTFVGIGSDNNGGAICCRNHIKRMYEDTGINLFVVIAGEENQKEATISFLNSLGVPNKFVPFRDSNTKQTNLWKKYITVQWERLASSQAHVDQVVLDTIKSTQADVLLFDYLYSALFCPNSIRLVPKKVVITLNRETELYRDLLNRTSCSFFIKAIRLLRTWYIERFIFKSVDQVIALSATDAPKLKGTYITPYLDQKKKQWVPNSSRTIFFVGSMGHYPNAEAIEYIATKLAPAIATIASDIRFKIIGVSSTEVSFSHPLVDFLGKSDSEEVERMFLNCHLFICPIKNTYGLKFKIAEAISYGTPFLLSPECMLCVPHLTEVPSLPLNNPLLAAKNIVALIQDEGAAEKLSKIISGQHKNFIASQKDIWSRTLTKLNHDSF